METVWILLLSLAKEAAKLDAEEVVAASSKARRSIHRVAVEEEDRELDFLKGPVAGTQCDEALRASYRHRLLLMRLPPQFPRAAVGDDRAA